MLHPGSPTLWVSCNHHIPGPKFHSLFQFIDLVGGKDVSHTTKKKEEETNKRGHSLKKNQEDSGPHGELSKGIHALHKLFDRPPWREKEDLKV